MIARVWAGLLAAAVALSPGEDLDGQPEYEPIDDEVPTP